MLSSRTTPERQFLSLRCKVVPAARPISGGYLRMQLRAQTDDWLTYNTSLHVAVLLLSDCPAGSHLPHLHLSTPACT